MLLNTKAVSNEPHEETKSFGPETLSFESLRKKGYESISNFIRGFLHNKKGNSVTNKEQTCVDEEQSDVSEIDNRDSTEEHVEAVKITLCT